MGKTITEAMKGLKVLEKRMMSNVRDIEQYSSKVSTEKAHFESDRAQTQEVQKLIQSNMDLQVEYRRLKKNIDYTNLMVEVEFDGVKYTIADLLLLKRKLGQQILMTFRALNERRAEQRLRGAPTIEGKAPFIERMYDEREKNEEIRKWQNLLDNIDIRLETVNATTDLIEHF